MPGPCAPCFSSKPLHTCPLLDVYWITSSFSGSTIRHKLLDHCWSFEANYHHNQVIKLWRILAEQFQLSWAVSIWQRFITALLWSFSSSHASSGGCSSTLEDICFRQKGEQALVLQITSLSDCPQISRQRPATPNKSCPMPEIQLDAIRPGSLFHLLFCFVFWQGYSLTGWCRFMSALHRVLVWHLQAHTFGLKLQ